MNHTDTYGGKQPPLRIERYPGDDRAFFPFRAFEEEESPVNLDDICGGAGWLKLPRLVVERYGERAQTLGALHLLTANRKDTLLSAAKIAETAVLSQRTVERHLRWLTGAKAILRHRVPNRRTLATSLHPEIRKLYRTDNYSVLPRWAAWELRKEPWSCRIVLAVLINQALTVRAVAASADYGTYEDYGLPLHLLAKHCHISKRTVESAAESFELCHGCLSAWDHFFSLEPAYWINRAMLEGLAPHRQDRQSCKDSDTHSPGKSGARTCQCGGPMCECGGLVRKSGGPVHANVAVERAKVADMESIGKALREESSLESISEGTLEGTSSLASPKLATTLLSAPTSGQKRKEQDPTEIAILEREWRQRLAAEEAQETRKPQRRILVTPESIEQRKTEFLEALAKVG